MFIRYNETAQYWEYDSSGGTGAGPWLVLPIDYSQIVNGPPSGLINHAPTHNTGGSDQITQLSGGVITSGTINDVRLSSNVALKNINNSFSVAQTVFGSFFVSGEYYERSRPKAIGEWTEEPYNASHFSAASGTWTGTPQNNRYSIVGKTMNWRFMMASSTLSVNSQYLSIVSPGGFSFPIAGTYGLIEIYTTNSIPGLLFTSGGSVMNVYRQDRLAIPAGPIQVGFSIPIEIA